MSQVGVVADEVGRAKEVKGEGEEDYVEDDFETGGGLFEGAIVVGDVFAGGKRHGAQDGPAVDGHDEEEDGAGEY